MGLYVAMAKLANPLLNSDCGRSPAGSAFEVSTSIVLDLLVSELGVEVFYSESQSFIDRLKEAGGFRAQFGYQQVQDAIGADSRRTIKEFIEVLILRRIADVRFNIDPVRISRFQKSRRART